MEGSIFVGFLLDERIADFSHTSIVAIAFSAFGFKIELFDINFVLLNSINEFLFATPFRLIIALHIFQIGNFFIHLSNVLCITIALNGSSFDFELCNFSRDFVEFFRHGIHFNSQFCGSLIHQVDSLVREEAITDVALTQLHGGNNGIVFNSHLMVIFVAFLQSTQDGDSAFLIGLINHHHLEASLQGFILLKIFLVFIERGGTDAAEFASGKSRLENIGGIHRAIAFAGTHQSVNFVDKKDDIALRRSDFANHGFQSLFKFTLIFCAGN